MMVINATEQEFLELLQMMNPDEIIRVEVEYDEDVVPAEGD